MRISGMIFICGFRFQHPCVSRRKLVRVRSHFQRGGTMSRALSVISVLAMLSGGCVYSRIASARLAAPQSAAEPASITETHLRRECAVTQSIRDQPPKDPNADPFPFGPWYINADRTIWAGWDAASCVSGQKGNKVLWIRPQGTQLRVTGPPSRRGRATSQGHHSVLLSHRISSQWSLLSHSRLLGGYRESWQQ